MSDKDDVMMLDMAVGAMFVDAVKHGGSVYTRYDEVSLLFANEAALVDFQHLCFRQGVEHFNSVSRDTMVRLDRQGESFDVRFEFFRLPGRLWRIEAMCILSGDAPLHEQALAEHGNGAPFHLSYKVNDIKEYAEDVQDLRTGRKHTMMAEYRNSYGMMSYWTHDGSKSPYIKPRINLRDAPIVY